ncbi:hypothetical protein IW261DRAFT_1592106 [Armillaria novae-zelandiae]|uniref:F-box domain-containing protein n=1 Tax=Armillaria novae-zelandiae TaxID=153914 RepID=A0AA39PED5_9AGAR|nr:hypothetical protein IW261DRAFT_1592106 [Armillaria novae-zelandiae]
MTQPRAFLILFFFPSYTVTTSIPLHSLSKSMTSVICNNCGFVNALLPPNPTCDGLVSELLRGSRTLLDVDRAFVDAEIEKLQELKAWYDDQLQEIQLRQLIVLKQLENHKSIYAPIRRLPRDILIEIFHWVWNAWPTTDPDEPDLIQESDSLDVTGPLWVLARVCGLWRDTLYASPASWAWYVVLGPPFPNHAREILQTYLERTGNHLLSLRVSCEGTDLTEAEEGQIMSLVVQCCHRWKNVCITVDKRHMHYLESISHLPALRAIEIDFVPVDKSIERHYKYLSDICLKAPQLRQATFPVHGICSMGLPPTVTHYSGYLPRADDFPLLSQLPNLRTCHFESSLLQPGSMPEVPAIMRELRQLYVGDLKVLNFLTAPILQHMTISLFGTPHLPVSTIILFFHRSRCRLESFSISTDVMEFEPSASIRELFSSEACSTVSSLKLGLYSIQHNVVDALASPSILPNLRHLCLCFNETMDPPTETERLALLNMIRSRCKARLLKTIEVQFDSEESYSIETDIQALGGDLEMREETWSPLYRDHQPFFWNP